MDSDIQKVIENVKRDFSSFLPNILLERRLIKHIKAPQTAASVLI